MRRQSPPTGGRRRGDGRIRERWVIFIGKQKSGLRKFISWVPGRMSKESVREKLDYMFKRIGGAKAKKMARPFYEKAILEVS